MALDNNRRPIAARSTSWARHTSTFLARTNVTPNQISALSIVFATAGAAALLCLSNWIGMTLCLIAIQGRLLCNLLDGMVAVEGNKSTPLGVVYNELPDRIADTVLIVALGYITPHSWLGWAAALAAAMTAYIRVLGGTLGLPQDFRGPMAKPHRMAVLSVACIGGVGEMALYDTRGLLMTAVVVILIGSIVTCFTRLRAIAHSLQARQ